MKLKVLSWIFIWGFAFSANANCPEANLRVRSTYVPAYVMEGAIASSETLDNGELRLNYGSVITIPWEYVTCEDNGRIDYRRSLMRWSKNANGADQTLIAKFEDRQEHSDVFFPIKTTDVKGKISNQTNYLNLITLLNNGLLAEGESKPNGERAIEIKGRNDPRFNSTDIYTVENGIRSLRIRQVSPVNGNMNSKIYHQLESIRLYCDQEGKNVCEDIRAIMPRLPRDFFEKYQWHRGPNIEETFVEAHQPFAVWHQIETSLPASQKIAQIMIETNTGGSRLYQVHNAIAGVSCSSALTNLQSEIRLHDSTVYIADKDCSTRRPEGGHYFTYASLEEGQLDWGDIFRMQGSYYPNIKAAAEAAKANGAYGVVTFYTRRESGRNVSYDGYAKMMKDLSKYAVDPGYASKVVSKMGALDDKYKLLDHPCQVCLQRQWSNKNGGAPNTKVKK